MSKSSSSSFRDHGGRGFGGGLDSATAARDQHDQLFRADQYSFSYDDEPAHSSSSSYNPPPQYHSQSETSGATGHTQSSLQKVRKSSKTSNSGSSVCSHHSNSVNTGTSKSTYPNGGRKNDFQRGGHLLRQPRGGDGGESGGNKEVVIEERGGKARAVWRFYNDDKNSEDDGDAASNLINDAFEQTVELNSAGGGGGNRREDPELRRIRKLVHKDQAKFSPGQEFRYVESDFALTHNDPGDNDEEIAPEAVVGFSFAARRSPEELAQVINKRVEILYSDHKLPLGRLNCATLKAAVEELRETFRACQIVDLITSFKFISEEDKIKKEREDERIETNRKSAEFIRNMFGNGMSLGMAPTPMMALMQPGMALDPADVAKCQAMAQGRELRVSLNGKAPVGSSKAPVEKPFDAGRHGNYADLKAANKTTLIFTPMEGGGLDARHVPVNSNTANTTTTGGASSSRDRPAPAGVAAGDVIFSPDLPGFVGHFKQDTMEEDDDEVSLFGTRAAARANGGSPGAIHASKLSSKVASKPPTPAKAMKKAMKKVPDIFPDADVEVEEEEVVKPAKKNKGGSPNPKPMKKVELVKKSPAMKKGKK